MAWKKVPARVKEKPLQWDEHFLRHLKRDLCRWYESTFYQDCTTYKTQIDHHLIEKDKLTKTQNTLRKQINQLQSNIETLTANLQNLENEIKTIKKTTTTTTTEITSIHRRCSIKKLFLNISKNSQENTCVGVSFK